MQDRIGMADDAWWLHLYVMFSRATRMADMLLLRPPPRRLLERGPPPSVRKALVVFERKIGDSQKPTRGPVPRGVAFPASAHVTATRHVAHRFRGNDLFRGNGNGLLRSHPCQMEPPDGTTTGSQSILVGCTHTRTHPTLNGLPDTAWPLSQNLA